MKNIERGAMKQALEALEKIADVNAMDYEYRRWAKESITAIKEALAGAEGERQPEQEPVGQLLEDAFGRGQVMWFNKPKDESMLYTTSPQRTWVGLTAEEREQVQAESYGKVPHHVALIAAVEAKLKEKNT